MRYILLFFLSILIVFLTQDVKAVIIDKQLTIQPYIICNSQGELCGYYQDSEAFLDMVYSPAGINVNVLEPIKINSPVGGITLGHPLHGELRLGISLDITGTGRIVELIKALQDNYILPIPAGNLNSPIEVYYISQYDTLSSLLKLYSDVRIRELLGLSNPTLSPFQVKLNFERGINAAALISLNKAFILTQGVLESSPTFSINRELFNVALAHELGHNLGINFHSFQGLMRATSLKEIFNNQAIKLDISLSAEEIKIIRESLFLKSLS